MKSRRPIWFGSLAILLVIGVAAFLSHTAEPTYEGRSLTAWLKDLLDPGKRSSAQTTRAVQAMGTEALPKLMQMFERKNKRLRHLLLRESAADWINAVWPPAELDHFLAAAGFNMLGTNAAPALPRLRQLLANGNGADQVRVLDVMRFLGPAAAGDIAAALTNRIPELRIAALCALSTNQFSAGALIKLLEPLVANDESLALRQAAQAAVERINGGEPKPPGVGEKSL